LDIVILVQANLFKSLTSVMSESESDVAVLKAEINARQLMKEFNPRSIVWGAIKVMLSRFRCINALIFWRNLAM
jgi:hypothetical protein